MKNMTQIIVFIDVAWIVSANYLTSLNKWQHPLTWDSLFHDHITWRAICKSYRYLQTTQSDLQIYASPGHAHRKFSQPPGLVCTGSRYDCTYPHLHFSAPSPATELSSFSKWHFVHIQLMVSSFIASNGQQFRMQDYYLPVMRRTWFRHLERSIPIGHADRYHLWFILERHNSLTDK